MFKKYYLVYGIINGVHFNSFTDLPIGTYITNCMNQGQKLIIVNYWRISKKEYLDLKSIGIKKNNIE